jgi:hypothetical protein
MRWLRRFFYSDDPAVRLVGALTEPEAEAWRELLENNGVPAFTKTIDPLISQGRATGADCALFVKQSDVPRAREILGPMLASREGQEGP